MKIRFLNSKYLYASLAVVALVAYSFIVQAAAPTGGYMPGATLDPDCAPGDTSPEPCIVQFSAGGGAYDLYVENSVAGFTAPVSTGDNAIALGDSSEATGDYSFAAGHGAHAWGENSVALGADSFAVGLASMAWGNFVGAIGSYSTAWGGETEANGNFSTVWGQNGKANGANSTVWGLGNIAFGAVSTSFGVQNISRSYGETSLGLYSTDYSAADALGIDAADRLLSVGNGTSSSDMHNALTMWKDGSFAFNDDNFINDSANEESKFFFDYSGQSIRMGSVDSNVWDPGTGNVGTRSVAIGFANPGIGYGAPAASGDNSTAFGLGTHAEGFASTAWGVDATAAGLLSTAWGVETSASAARSTAWGDGAVASGSTATAWGVRSISSGDQSTTWGNNSTSSGEIATAWGSLSEASAYVSTAFGYENYARSAYETSFGMFGTDYTPNNAGGADGADRLVNIGNGLGGAPADAFTILKSGITGIGFSNFETTSNTELLQVNGDIRAAGGIVQTSDRRLKSNIRDISYGLNAVTALKPVAYNLNRDGSAQLGFIAQDVQTVLPELVVNGQYLALNYTGMIPVLTKAIQELDLKIKNIDEASQSSGVNSSSTEWLKSWLGNASNGLNEFFAKIIHSDKVYTKELCVGSTCLTETQVQRVLNSIGASPAPSAPVAPDPEPEAPAIEPEPEQVSVQEEVQPEPEAPAPEQESAPLPEPAPEIIVTE